LISLKKYRDRTIKGRKRGHPAGRFFSGKKCIDRNMMAAELKITRKYHTALARFRGRQARGT